MENVDAYRENNGEYPGFVIAKRERSERMARLASVVGQKSQLRSIFFCIGQRALAGDRARDIECLNRYTEHSVHEMLVEIREIDRIGEGALSMYRQIQDKAERRA